MCVMVVVRVARRARRLHGRLLVRHERHRRLHLHLHLRRRRAVVNGVERSVRVERRGWAVARKVPRLVGVHAHRARHRCGGLLLLVRLRQAAPLRLGRRQRRPRRCRRRRRRRRR